MQLREVLIEFHTLSRSDDVGDLYNFTCHCRLCFPPTKESCVKAGLGNEEWCGGAEGSFVNRQTLEEAGDEERKD